MALKDPTLMKAKDDEMSPEDRVSNPDVGGVPGQMPALFNPGAMFPEAPAKGLGDVSAPAPKKGGPNPLLVNSDDLKNAAEEKRKLAVMGAVGDNLANRQSFGNFFLGHMNPKNDGASKLMGQLSEQADQPVQQKMALQKQTEAAPGLQLAKDAMDPTSSYSKSKQDELRATIGALTKFGQMDKDKAQAMLSNVDGMNGFQSGKVLESMKPVTDILKAQSMLAMTQRRLDQSDTKIGMAKDNQANTAVGFIDKDPLIQSNQRQLSQIGVDRHTLESADIITPQMVHEISNGIAGALNQGKSVGLGMAEMQDMSTSQTAFAAFEQKLLNKSVNGASPEIRKQMLDTLDRLEASYKKVQSARVAQLNVGHSYQSNPAAQAAIDQKVQSYQPQSPGSDPGYSVVPQAQADQAKGPHGATIYQNGHTFTWNPKTKDYE